MQKVVTEVEAAICFVIKNIQRFEVVVSEPCSNSAAASKGAKLGGEQLASATSDTQDASLQLSDFGKLAFSKGKPLIQNISSDH